MSLCAAVVPHDERDMIFAEGSILAHELGDIDARHGIRRNGPGCRNRPVAGIDQAGRRVAQRRGLVLHAGVLDGGDLPGAHAAIVAEAIDIDPVVR